jgi:hypothetical protein
MKLRDGGIIPRKPRVSLTKRPREGVSGPDSRSKHDRRSELYLAGGRTDTSARQVGSGRVEALTRRAHGSAVC